MRTPERSRPCSQRVALARTAARAIAQQEGLFPVESGRWFTADREERIEGVVVAASASGAIDVDLHLSAGWPTGCLHAMAARLRDRMVEQAERDGVQARLGRVDVAVHDIVPVAGGRGR